MTRRMLAAISVLALATVAPLALFPGSVSAQQYILSLTDASGPPGGLVEVQVMFDNNGGDVQGWGFGVAHDPAIATLIGVVDGSTTLTVNNGSPPNFNQVNVQSDTGFSVGVVVCFTGCAVLSGGSLNNELNVATYQLGSTGTHGTSSQLEFCNCIGNPTVETIVVVNGSSVIPTTEDGTLFFECTDTPAPPTNLTCVIDTTPPCECTALLEWSTPSDHSASVTEIWLDGQVVGTIPADWESTTLALPQAGTVSLCIRYLCGNLFSPFVCCTVNCNEEDCDDNGSPDYCDIGQGAPDCNSNGIPDECELSSGSSPDCNGNQIPDECEFNSTVDCNSNGVLDECDIIIGISEDCNANAVPDECEIESGTSADCNSNGIPDICEYSAQSDCNSNGIIDDCDILLGISEDCNANNTPDECDIADGMADTNGDGIPDACEDAPFLRGDNNSDGSIDVGDGVFGLAFLFSNGPPPGCLDTADVNQDLAIDIGDAVYLLAFLFNSGPPPLPPYPACGLNANRNTLGCEEYEACP